MSDTTLPSMDTYGGRDFVPLLRRLAFETAAEGRHRRPRQPQAKARPRARPEVHLQPQLERRQFVAAMPEHEQEQPQPQERPGPEREQEQQQPQPQEHSGPQQEPPPQIPEELDQPEQRRPLAAQPEHEMDQAPPDPHGVEREGASAATLLEEEVDWGPSDPEPAGGELSDDEAAGEENVAGEEALATPEAFLRVIALAGQRLRPSWVKQEWERALPAGGVAGKSEEHELKWRGGGAIEGASHKGASDSAGREGEGGGTWAGNAYQLPHRHCTIGYPGATRRIHACGEGSECRGFQLRPAVPNPYKRFRDTRRRIDPPSAADAITSELEQSAPETDVLNADFLKTLRRMSLEGLAALPGSGDAWWSCAPTDPGGKGESGLALARALIRHRHDGEVREAPAGKVQGCLRSCCFSVFPYSLVDCSFQTLGLPCAVLLHCRTGIQVWLVAPT